MAAFNLCMLFYNLFGKPRHYPAAPPLRKRAHDRQEEAAAPEDTDEEAAQGMPAANRAGAQSEDGAAQGENEAANGENEAANGGPGEDTGAGACSSEEKM